MSVSLSNDSGGPDGQRVSRSQDGADRRAAESGHGGGDHNAPATEKAVVSREDGAADRAAGETSQALVDAQMADRAHHAALQALKAAQQMMQEVVDIGE